MSRSKSRDAAPARFITCELCKREGIVGVEVAPYWYGAKIKHKWHHSSCAEQYRTALAAAQRERAAGDCKQAALEEGKAARVKSGIDMTKE